MRASPIWTLALIASGSFANAQATDPVVAEVIEIAKASALNGALPDWAIVEQQASAMAKASPGEAGRTEAIRHVLAALRDVHSGYRPPMAQAGQVREPGVHRPIAEATVGDAGIGRLTINTWTGSQDALGDATRAVNRALKEAMVGDSCGLVSNVSSSTGGNMWPMMGGIAPLYDEGTLVFFEDRRNVRQVVSMQAGLLRMNGSAFPRVELEKTERRPSRIAVIVGPKTASSAEILALAFKGQSNVRLFGEETAGATTANRSIRLSNGGLVALTTARIRDRDGHIQQGPIKPDTYTKSPIADAEAWLSDGCRRMQSQRTPGKRRPPG